MFEKLQEALLRWIGGPPLRVDETTSIESDGQHAWKYMEQDHVVRVEVAATYSEPSRIIYADSIKAWLPPHEEEELTEADRARIVKKISLFMERKGISSKVE